MTQETAIAQLYTNFPQLKNFSFSRLATMDADELVKVYTALTEIEASIQKQIYTLDAQRVANEAALLELRTKIQSELGVSTPEELDALIAKLTLSLTEKGTELHNFLNPEVTPALESQPF